MTKKGKTVLAVTISTAAILLGAAATAVIICKKIYEKKYFSAN